MTNKYSSIEEAIKSSDFREVLSYLENYYIGKPELKKLLTKTQDKPVCELDRYLTLLPKYSIEPRTREAVKINEPVELIDGALEVASKFLELGANPNATIKNGINPFLLSCKINNPALVALMLDNPYTPANINWGDGRGDRALVYAVKAQADKVMDYLVLEKGMDINFKYILSNNKTVLHKACLEAKEKSIYKLIEYGVDPTIKDDFKKLPCELIPAFDPEEHDEGMFEEDEIKLWDSLFEVLEEYRKKYVEKNKVIHKTKF